MLVNQDLMEYIADNGLADNNTDNYNSNIARLHGYELAKRGLFVLNSSSFSIHRKHLKTRGALVIGDVDFSRAIAAGFLKKFTKNKIKNFSIGETTLLNTQDETYIYFPANDLPEDYGHLAGLVDEVYARFVPINHVIISEVHIHKDADFAIDPDISNQAAHFELVNQMKNFYERTSIKDERKDSKAKILQINDLVDSLTFLSPATQFIKVSKLKEYGCSSDKFSFHYTYQLKQHLGLINEINEKMLEYHRKV